MNILCSNMLTYQLSTELGVADIKVTVSTAYQ